MEDRRTRAKADGKQRCLESRVHIRNTRGEAHDCLLTSQGLPSYEGSSSDCARPEGEAGCPTSRESARGSGSEVTAARNSRLCLRYTVEFAHPNAFGALCAYHSILLFAASGHCYISCYCPGKK